MKQYADNPPGWACVLIVLGLLIVGAVNLIASRVGIPTTAAVLLMLGNVLTLVGVSFMLWYMGILAVEV
jgi:hypothetical protein